MSTATHGRPLDIRHSIRWPAALIKKPSGTTFRGPNRCSRRANTGTAATTTIAVAITMKGSDVAGQAVRNAASRNAFDDTWCAIMQAATACARRVTPLLVTIVGSSGPSDDRQRFAERAFESPT